jgi:hypothetical protein
MTGSIGWLVLLAAGLLLAGTARADRFVAVGGTGDGSSWASPTNSIQGAIDAASAGETILVSNGTYNITNDIAVNKAVTISSFANGVTGGLTNAARTIVSRGGGKWNFYITAAAIVDGFTGTGASAGGYPGANFYVSAGAIVKSCILRSNGTGYGGSHPAGHMISGIVSNCLIYGNSTGDRQHSPGAFRIDGGTMVACQITGNTLVTQADGGGGVWLNGSSAALRNCLLYRNSTTGSGGGVFLSDGTVENCTIVNNTAGGSGGGIYRTGGIVRNCIVYNNTTNNINNPDESVTYTCTANPDAAGDGCINADPLFVNIAAANYRLHPGSPCVDAGQNQDWMAAATDLAGSPRIFHDIVDMGAYETWPVVPMLRSAGVSKLTDKTATVRCNITWLGADEAALFLCHGLDDGGTNRQAWANEVRLLGPIGVGFHDVDITHAASNRTWCYRWFATNVNGAVCADSSGGLMLGAVEVRVTRRESTEEKPAAFVITRPAASVNGPLDVYFTLGGTGVNGTDYDRIESPAVIPAGAVEVRLPVVPNFSTDERQSKGVELTLAPGGYAIGVNNKASIVTKAQ